VHRAEWTDERWAAEWGSGREPDRAEPAAGGEHIDRGDYQTEEGQVMQLLYMAKMIGALMSFMCRRNAFELQKGSPMKHCRSCSSAGGHKNWRRAA
jgi:hypothetical protein